MFAAFDSAQHFLVSTDAEEADVEFVGVSGQVEGGVAGFGWVYIVAVAGDAAELDLLEGCIQVVEGQDDEMFA